MFDGGFAAGVPVAAREVAGARKPKAPNAVQVAIRVNFPRIALVSGYTTCTGLQAYITARVNARHGRSVAATNR
jgi:hypothetical protein